MHVMIAMSLTMVAVSEESAKVAVEAETEVWEVFSMTRMCVSLSQRDLPEPTNAVFV